MAHRIDTSTAQKDKFGVGKNGFTRGNPQTGVPATELDDDYFDMLQEEIVGIVEAAGDTLDKTQRNQLNAALGKLFQNKTAATSALGALAPAANRLPYFTGANGASLTELTPVGRDILASATKTAALEYLGLGDVVRDTRSINGKRLNADITLTAAEMGIGQATESKPGIVQISDAINANDSRVAASSAAVYRLLPKRVYTTNDFIRIPDMPGGLIIQWGLLNSGTTAYYPTPFSYACCYVTQCPQSMDTGPHGLIYHHVSGFDAARWERPALITSVPCRWLAIGF